MRLPLLGFGIGLLFALSAQAAPRDSVLVFENHGPRVGLGVYDNGRVCDLTPEGRGVTDLGWPNRARQREYLARDLEAGKPVEFVFRRLVNRAMRVGIPATDYVGVRARLVPNAGLEYRARVDHQAMGLDVVVESRPLGSTGAFAPVEVETSHAFSDLCVRGAGRPYGIAMR